MPAARREARVPNKHFASRTLSKARVPKTWSTGTCCKTDGRKSPRTRPDLCQPGVLDPAWGYSPRTAKRARQVLGGSGVEKARVPAICQPGAQTPLGVPPRPCQDRPKKARPSQWSWVWGPSLLPNGKRSLAGWVTTGLVYRQALPSLTVLTRRSGASVGASSAHANGQRRSRLFWVWGLGFGV